MALQRVLIPAQVSRYQTPQRRILRDYAVGRLLHLFGRSDAVSLEFTHLLLQLGHILFAAVAKITLVDEVPLLRLECVIVAVGVCCLLHGCQFDHSHKIEFSR